MKVYENVSSLIGNTPLVRLNGYQKAKGLKANLLGKLEYFNPAGSIKDRIALYMLADAREKGLLNEDSVIIEPTSGNTGIGLAAVAAEKGYRTIIGAYLTPTSSKDSGVKSHCFMLMLANCTNSNFSKIRAMGTAYP